MNAITKSTVVTSGTTSMHTWSHNDLVRVMHDKTSYDASASDNIVAPTPTVAWELAAIAGADMYVVTIVPVFSELVEGEERELLGFAPRTWGTGIRYNGEMDW